MKEYQDKELECSDCSAMFTIRASAQKFFDEKGLSQPKRCIPCREANRKKHEAAGIPQFKKEKLQPPAPAPVNKQKIEVEPSAVGQNGERQWTF